MFGLSRFPKIGPICDPATGQPTCFQSLTQGFWKSLSWPVNGDKTRSVFDRYNIVSERDLHDAARRLNSYVAEAEKTPDGDNVVTVAQDSANLTTGGRAAKRLN
jgi:hypothetical protein